jgi:tetratricopeptide (TPR) repeat protein
LEEIKDKKGIAFSFNNIGYIFFKQKNYSKALEFCNRSMQWCKETGYPENIRNTAGVLNQIYKATHDYKLALENYELFIQMRDSINNESTRKASIKQQLKHEYETKAAADSVAHAKETDIKNAELAKQQAEIKAKKNQQYALFGGLGLVMVFAGFMYNRFKVTQKQKGIIELQKNEVEEQKKLVEEKQKEILDSIHYAKRIQLAQIPNEKRVYSMIVRLKK